MTQTEGRAPAVLRVVTKLLSLRNKNAQKKQMQTKGVKRHLPSPSHPLKKTYTREAKNHVIIDFTGALKEKLVANILSKNLDGMFRLYILKLVTVMYLPQSLISLGYWGTNQSWIGQRPVPLTRAPKILLFLFNFF